MVVLFLLSFPQYSINDIVGVVIDWYSRHVLVEVVLVVAEGLLQRLPAQEIVLPDARFGIVEGTI